MCPAISNILLLCSPLNAPTFVCNAAKAHSPFWTLESSVPLISERVIPWRKDLDQLRDSSEAVVFATKINDVHLTHFMLVPVALHGFAVGESGLPVFACELWLLVHIGREKRRYETCMRDG